MAARKPTDPKNDLEKLAVYAGHDSDIPLEEEYIFNAQREEDMHENFQRRRSSLGSRRSRKSHKEHKKSVDVLKERDVEKEYVQVKPSLVTNAEANVVWWDSPDDSQNPMNWATWKKVVNLTLISCICFLTPLGSCRLSVKLFVSSLMLIILSNVRSWRPRTHGTVSQ